ncbi:hypothetical protein [Phaeodactylibacter xiamenensis]|uniref:hypothetical protein n=1 Tax=Phaeodactylibacter xiamenensis TaxID=1524460 RepID=UPI003BAD3BA5
MRIFRYLLPVLLLWGCADPYSTDTEAAATEPTDTIAPAIVRQAPRPDCPVPGKVLSGNTYNSPAQELYLAIVADSTTYDEKLGDSHRKLIVFNSSNCERLLEQTLPVDRSADFHYQIADINYNSAVQQLAIRGTTHFFLFDLEGRQLSGPFQPQFKSERYGVDAQSGNIQHLEMWESYLIGYVQDYGSFVFRLDDGESPEPVFPASEYQDEIEAYHQAFLLPSDRGAQVLMPSYDRGDRLFRINPVFERPIALQPREGLTAQENRFLLLREDSSNERAIVIDLKNREQAELPSDIQWKSDEDVLDWMKVMQ